MQSFIIAVIPSYMGDKMKRSSLAHSFIVVPVVSLPFSIVCNKSPEQHANAESAPPQPFVLNIVGEVLKVRANDHGISKSIFEPWCVQLDFASSGN